MPFMFLNLIGDLLLDVRISLVDIVDRRFGPDALSLHHGHALLELRQLGFGGGKGRGGLL